MIPSTVSEQAETPTAPAAPDVTERYAPLLASGERVLVVRRRHWFTFVASARWFLLVFGAAIVVEILNGSVGNGGISGHVSTGLTWIFVAGLLVALAGLGWEYLAWQRLRYLVTTRRVIEAGGVINKWSHDTSLEMINDMEVDHPLFGRIFGYGTVDLLTASEAGTNKLTFLPDADGFKKTLLDAKYEHQVDVESGGRAAVAPPPAAAPVADDHMTAQEVDEAVTRLADMRDRGMITAEEFEAKKRDLLDRL
jgi:uncharacterized membrane protein YdbT with pleckstrin-like domain